VVQVPRKVGPLTVELETTVFKPRGDGPFSIVLMNHGKTAGDPRFQPRYRPRQAAAFFLDRGYAVVAPMRQGFSKSGGAYVGGGCNIESNGRAQADDLAAALDYVRTQPWVDKDRIVVLGQSHGGWATLALGARGYPGVKGLINFAGGLRQERGCTGWQGNLARAAGAYGKGTHLPSLWLYGDNDSFFPVEVFRPMHERYQAAGGKAELIAYGKFGNDSHTLFASPDGARIWHEPVARFLKSIGVPWEPKTGDGAAAEVGEKRAP
ncbi:MAG: CocE/NonD family hydrolase, partial [Burkholderiales bacterium]